MDRGLSRRTCEGGQEDWKDNRLPKPGIRRDFRGQTSQRLPRPEIEKERTLSIEPDENEVVEASKVGLGPRGRGMSGRVNPDSQMNAIAAPLRSTWASKVISRDLKNRIAIGRYRNLKSRRPKFFTERRLRVASEEIAP